MKDKKEEGYVEYVGWLSDEAGVFPNNSVLNHWNSIIIKNLKPTINERNIILCGVDKFR